MTRVQVVATCLVAMLMVGGGTHAAAQTSASRSSVRAAQAIREATVDRTVFDRTAAQWFAMRSERAIRAAYGPHRHWSWLFPSTPVPPFASDPLMRRHWWQDPLLRRDWWR